MCRALPAFRPLDDDGVYLPYNSFPVRFVFMGVFCLSSFAFLLICCSEEKRKRQDNIPS
jgi:hypothetical protein